jgi:hypothetical protein
MRRISLGGFPGAVAMPTDRLRSAWFEDYRRTLIARDLTQLSAVRQVEELPRLLRLLAARTGQELNVGSLEARDGRIVAVEMKFARDVDESEFKWLAYLRDRLGDRYVNGIVVRLGERPAAFGDRLTALPVSAVWS